MDTARSVLASGSLASLCRMAVATETSGILLAGSADRLCRLRGNTYTCYHRTLLALMASTLGLAGRFLALASDILLYA